MFRNIRYFFALLTLSLAAVTVTSCGDDKDEPETPEVTLAPGAETDITIECQASVVAGKIAFNSTGDWVAEISPAARENNKPDWIEISSDHGSRGVYSLQLFVTPNNTHDVRRAVVTIISPTNSLVFKVAQKGRPTGSGDTPVPNPGE